MLPSLQGAEAPGAARAAMQRKSVAAHNHALIMAAQNKSKPSARPDGRPDSPAGRLKRAGSKVSKVALTSASIDAALAVDAALLDADITRAPR
eukprot:4794278-Prymnesium_polylepis.1